MSFETIVLGELVRVDLIGFKYDFLLRKSRSCAIIIYCVKIKRI